MNPITFYLYQLSWHVFGMLLAFAAAWFFWDKGTATVDGHRLPWLGHGWRLTGAGGILIAVLLVVHAVDPLADLTDDDRFLLVYQAFETRSVLIDVDQLDGIASLKTEELDDWTIKVVPYESVYEMGLLSSGAYKTLAPIPRGDYWVRIVDPSTNEVKQVLQEL